MTSLQGMSINQMIKVTLEAVVQSPLAEDHPYIHKINFQIGILLRRHRRAIEMLLAISGVKLTGNCWYFTMANNTIEVLLHKFSAVYWVILFQRQLCSSTYFLFEYCPSYNNLKPACCTNNRQNKHSI